MELILFLVCVNSLYWVLVAVSATNKTIIYYDSMYGNGEAVRAKIFQFLQVRFHTKTGQPLNITEWIFKDEKSVTREIKQTPSTAKCFFVRWQNASPVEVPSISTNPKCRQFETK